MVLYGQTYIWLMGEHIFLYLLIIIRLFWVLLVEVWQQHQHTHNPSQATEATEPEVVEVVEVDTPKKQTVLESVVMVVLDTLKLPGGKTYIDMI